MQLYDEIKLIVFYVTLGKTLDSGLRKKKCTSEQYARERKSNASKQFAYNKLKSEKQQMAMKSKPSRPPQPKVPNAEAEKEGMLIDLSPNDGGVLSISSSRQMAMSQTPSMNISLLDAPIDVPTENMETNSYNLATTSSDSKPEPPPYQSPPTYINTLGINTQSDNNYALNNFQQNQFDPFDTSYIGSETVTHRYGSTNVTRQQLNQNSTADAQILKHSNNQNGAIAKQKIMTTQLDTLVMNTMVSLSPRSSVKNLSTLVSNDVKSNMTTNNLTQWNTRSQLNVSQGSIVNETLDVSMADADVITFNNETDQSLSESLKVNLSSLSIDDSINSSFNTPKKLDKAFYAELEKEIYKNESSAASLIVNTSQTYAGNSSNKENSVSTMPSEIYERRTAGNSSDILNLNKVQNLSPRPLKYANTMTKSINQEIAQNNRAIYESSALNFSYHNNVQTAATSAASSKNYSHIPYQFQKQNNTDTNGAVSGSSIDTNSVINQIWFEQQNTVGLATANVQPVAVAQPLPSTTDSPRKQGQYGNIPTTTEKNHNFVAISNRAPINNQQINDLTRQVNNMYSSVAGDIYGSVAGDIYESIMPPGSARYGSIPRNSQVYGNSSAATLPSMQPVLYDEVASEELLRPHRPAPVVPLMQPLSAQQIQRRLERQQLYGNLPNQATNESQKVTALMREIGDEATHAEVVQALQSANWDHSIAIRHFKIERLVR